ncbi:MAG TPA: 2-amino-4-hydroxy-6-hydroxymethyldihydropteridine diphosphokinase [Abditibacteriaceae bacterium]|jgi:2-amino-4-hydroxy-6-hydroxymethyldihydropteridine diphosphokinase
MTTAYLALGSNVGDRAANLHAACDALEAAGVAVVARSHIYQTPPAEGCGGEEFFNAALRIETKLSARELLTLCLETEARLGREMPPRHGPRPLDIDILLFGDETHDEPDLQIPHPRMLHRAFVLRPLCDVLDGAQWKESTVEFGHSL